LIAGPAGPSLSAGGLTAEIDAAGNYTLTSDASFGGPVVVTFVSSGPGGVDGASVLAAASIPIGADYTANDAARTVSALDFYPVVDVSGPVTVSVDCTANAGVQVALAVLNVVGGAPTGDLAYVNPLATGSAMTLCVTYNSSGSIMPAVQAAGGSATFSNLAISAAPAVPDLAIGANAVDLAQVTASLGAGAPLDGNFNAVTDVAATFPISPNGAVGTPGLSSENNSGASGGSIALGEAGDGFDNITVVAQASAPGNVKAQVWAKGENAHLDLVMIQIGGAGQQTAIGNQGAFSSANWAPVSCSGQLLQAGTLLVVAQGVGGGDGSVLIDDLTVTQVQDLDAYFDAALLGL
jgi:hypothetical protein